jgi:hypothetical protein
MKFHEVIADIKLLVGKELKSIKPGANIRLTKVNIADNQLELVMSTGKPRTRSLDEIQRIWEQLTSYPAVHVDSALGGSGTSRNQPETIFANLPYIEVVYLSQKKHIAYVGKHTHAMGTVKGMDDIGAQKVKAALQGMRPTLPDIIIVTDDTRALSSSLETISGLTPNASMPGLYGHNIHGKELLVVGTSSIPQHLAEGVYIPLDSRTRPPGGVEVLIGETEYQLIVRNGVNLLVRDNS